MSPKTLVLPIALASTLGALFYVDKQYKKLAPEDQEKKSKNLKNIKLGLVGASVCLCLGMIYMYINARRVSSSFENRVAHAANTLRSSMNLSGRSSMNLRGPRNEDADFSKRVSKAAEDLRKQIASSSAQLSSSKPMASSDLAARASAEISQFIADNS